MTRSPRRTAPRPRDSFSAAPSFPAIPFAVGSSAQPRFVGSSIRRRILDAALDAVAIIAPTRCRGCGARDRTLCDSCARMLADEPLVRERFLIAAGAQVPLVAAHRYDGVARLVLLAFKDGGTTQLGRPLGRDLRRALDECWRLSREAHDSERPPRVVPIPSSPRAFAQRGYRPVDSLARGARVPFLRALRARRGRVDQVGLDVGSRLDNRRGAFRPTRRAAAQQYLLVDDVVTSGATVRAAAAAVQLAGGEVIGIAAFARTPRKSPEKSRSAHPPDSQVTDTQGSTTVDQKAWRIRP